MADTFDTSDFQPDEAFDTSDFVPEPVSGNLQAGQTPQAVERGGVDLDPSMVAAQQAAYNGPKHPDLDAAVSTAHDFAGEMGRSAAGQAAGIASTLWNSTVGTVGGALAGDIASLRSGSPEAGDAADKAWRDRTSWHPSSVYAPEGANLITTPFDILSRAVKSVSTPEGFRSLDGWARESWGDHYVDQVENELHAGQPALLNMLQQTPRAAAVAAAAVKRTAPDVYAAAQRWAPTVSRNLQAAGAVAGGAAALRGAAGRAWGSFEGEPTGVPPETGGAPPGVPAASVMPEDMPPSSVLAVNSPATVTPVAGATGGAFVQKIADYYRNSEKYRVSLPDSEVPHSTHETAAQALDVANRLNAGEQIPSSHWHHPNEAIPEIGQPGYDPVIAAQMEAAGAQKATASAAAVAPRTQQTAPAPTPEAPGPQPAPSQGSPRSMFALPAEDAAREGAPPLSPQEVDARAALLQRTLGAALPEVHTSLLEGNYTQTGNDFATARASNVAELRERATGLVGAASEAVDSNVHDMSDEADSSPAATKARSQVVADAMTALSGHLDNHIQLMYNRAKAEGGVVDMTPFEKWMEDNKTEFGLVDAGKTLHSGTLTRLKALSEMPGGMTPERVDALRKSVLRSYKPETGHLIRGNADITGIVPAIDSAIAQSLGPDAYAAAHEARTLRGTLIDNSPSNARFAPGPGNTPEKRELNREVPSEAVLPKLLGSSTSTPEFQSYFDALKRGRDALATSRDQAAADDMTARIGRAFDATRQEIGANAHAAGQNEKGWQQKKFVQYLQANETKMHVVEGADRMSKWKDLVDSGNILKYDKEYKGAVAQGVQAGTAAGNAITTLAGHAVDAKTQGTSALLGGGQRIARGTFGLIPGVDSPTKAIKRYENRVTNLQTYTPRAP